MPDNAHIIPRFFDEALRNSLKSNLITVILGPRQTGKTTSATMLLSSVAPNHKYILDFDSSFVRDKVKTQERFFIEGIESVLQMPFEDFKGERFYLFIDEAQKCPSAFEMIKRLYDQYSPRLKIILTGSSVLEMMDKTAETLAGRIQTFHLYPFTISEAATYLDFGNIPSSRELFLSILNGKIEESFLLELLRIRRPVREATTSLINELITGTLFPPAYSLIKKEETDQWILDYIDTYIEKDMRSVSEIGNMEGYRKTMIGLAARTAQLLQFTSLASDADIHPLTVKKYITLWEESFIGKRLYPFFTNPSTRIKKSQKIIFLDNGICWALAGFPEKELLKAAGKTGLLFENLIINEFLKYALLVPQRPQFYFWEKTQACEIDLIIHTKGLVIPIEIKWGSQVDSAWTRSLRIFKQSHKDHSIPFSLVIYNGEYKKLDNDIYCIPAWLMS